MFLYDVRVCHSLSPLPMKRQRAEISSNVISHIKPAHPIEMWRSNKLGIKEKISRGEFPRPIFSCPVPSGLPHRSHCVPMNINRLIPVIFFRNPQLFEILNFRRFIKTHTLTHTGNKLYPRKWTRDFDPWPRSADTHLTHRVRSAAPVL